MDFFFFFFKGSYEFTGEGRRENYFELHTSEQENYMLKDNHIRKILNCRGSENSIFKD